MQPTGVKRLPMPTSGTSKEAAALSDTLLGPVAKSMAGKRLVIVSDGALLYLPFAALPLPHRDGFVPILVEHEVVSLPSASVLAWLRRNSENRATPGKAVAVLADPVFESDNPRLTVQRHASRAGPTRGSLRDATLDFSRLVSTRLEADAIASSAAPGATFKALDFDASRATATSQDLANYRIVHFATHGVFDTEHPERSGLVLSMFDSQGHPQDGFLRLRDIYNLHLRADLVVLSACNTALGKSVAGEGLVGIVRGFMHAGATRVVASLWKVDDEATGELMGRFYAAMLKQNRSPAAALRQAQLEISQLERWQSPFYWAAFVLQGDWR